MKRIAAVLFERFGLLMLAAALTALFLYYGGVRFQAALLLGFAFALIAVWLYLLRKIAAFKPYRLVIGINYEALWEDLKLAPIGEVKFENTTFTAISAALFARSDEREYSTKLDLYKKIPCGAATYTPGVGEIRNGPTFFLRPMRDGHQFGINVQQEWWKLHRLQLNPSLRDKLLAYDNTIVLGLLPYGYMPEHVRRWTEPISLWYWFDLNQRRWKAKLLKEGWTFDDDWPTRLEHRYLDIGYDDL